MKKLVFLSLMFLIKSFNPIWAQESINFTGGNISNTTGSVSFSIGEVVFNSFSNTDFNITHGVQHSIEVFLVETAEISSPFSAQVFPNPSSEQIQIKLPSNLTGTYSFKLIDLNGKELLNHLVKESFAVIDISTFESATYYLLISSEDSVIQTFKVIKN